MMESMNARLSRIHEREHAATLFLNRMGSDLLVNGLFGVISRLGNGMFWYVLMAYLLLRHQHAALPAVSHMVATGLACLLLYTWLKKKTLRPRPYQRDNSIRVTVAPLDEYSFPSGHTLHAVAFTVVLAAYYPGMLWLTAPFTILVALSRLVLGLHYPSDVMAGALIGATVASLSLSL